LPIHLSAQENIVGKDEDSKSPRAKNGGKALQNGPCSGERGAREREEKRDHATPHQPNGVCRTEKKEREQKTFFLAALCGKPERGNRARKAVTPITRRGKEGNICMQP